MLKFNVDTNGDSEVSMLYDNARRGNTPRIASGTNGVVKGLKLASRVKTSYPRPLFQMEYPIKPWLKTSCRIRVVLIGTLVGIRRFSLSSFSLLELGEEDRWRMVLDFR